ncbi:hypothetical protein, partial [Pseudomonas peli]|uniref:hypothetical protein n=1 Tax=Pseudomonas peli TaxID=592361 RepID=UPI003D3203CB
MVAELIAAHLAENLSLIHISSPRDGLWASGREAKMCMRDSRGASSAAADVYRSQRFWGVSPMVDELMAADLAGN